MSATYKIQFTGMYLMRECTIILESSKRILDDAMMAGFVGVTIIVCVVLGQPGVGKTCIKYLLLDQRPPCLRSSTICAETPIRIEIKRLSEARIQTLEGNWKEVKGEEMLETVARMILLAERDTCSPLDGETTAKEATGKDTKKKKNVLTKIVNWIAKHSKEDASGSKKAGASRVAEATSKDDSEEGASAKAVSLPSDACLSAMKKIMDKLVQCIMKLKKEEGDLEALSHPLTEQLLRSLWIYFSDCGGQPQYHELLPLFVRRISSALCVTRLTDKLDEVQAVEYYDEGKRVGVPQEAQLSAKDTIQCLVNTIQSYSTQDKAPSIIMVGTHLDQLEEKLKQPSLTEASCQPSFGATAQSSAQPVASERIETLEEKNEQLLEMLEPEFSDQLVYFSSDMKQLLFPLNALGRGQREKAIAHTMRCAVEKSGAREVKVPVWWYVLELLLQELAKELGRGVLSRAECLEMARLLNIKEESFDAALVYFDELNVIKYSPKVLPGVVFVDSQIPLDKVSELVYHSYLLRQPIVVAEAGEPFPENSVIKGWKDFRDHGVVSEDCLEQFSRHYVPNIFTKDDISKLLMSLLVFAEISPPYWVKDTHSKKQKYYVMLSLLPTLPEAELEKHRVSSPVAATLIVRFPGGSRRAGVFCCFVTHLIRHCGWDLLLKSKQPLYRNCVWLQLLTSPPCAITLIDSNTYIEVRVNITAPVPCSEYAGHFPIIRQAILNGIRSACSRLNYKTTKPELTFLCPHTSSFSSPLASADHSREVKQHTATLTKDRKYWSCDLQPQLSGLLDERHSIWFSAPRGETFSVYLLAKPKFIPYRCTKCCCQSRSTNFN